MGEREQQARGSDDSELLDYAFGELLWISEAPNRDEGLTADALALAEYARRALRPIEAGSKAGPQ